MPPSSRKGKRGVHGYALAATALSGAPATYKMPSSERAPAKRGTCDPNKLYLDSAATYPSVFAIWCMKNVREAGRTLRKNCNAGVKECSKVGDLGIFEMWVNEGGIANLLSIPQLEKDGFRVTSDTNGEWIVYLPRGEKLVFKQDTRNLKNMPFIEMGDIVEAFAHANIEADQDIKAIQERNIQTVCMKMKDFSRREVKGAIAARKAQIMLADPPDARFKQLVNSDSIKNCKVTAQDISNSRVVFGPDLPGLQGKTTRKNPTRVVSVYMGIPRAIYERYKDIVLTTDFMFVNGISFLVTLSRGIRLYTTEHLPNRKKDQLARSLHRVMNLYARGGFRVRTIMMDMEFEKVKD